MKKMLFILLPLYILATGLAGCEKEDTADTERNNNVSVSNISYSLCDNTLSSNEYIKYYAVNDSTLGFEHKQIVNCILDSCNVKLEYENDEIVIDVYDYGDDSNCLCPVKINYEIRNLKKNNSYSFTFKRHSLVLHKCKITFTLNTVDTVNL
jgi:hypothetical protein